MPLIIKYAQEKTMEETNNTARKQRLAWAVLTKSTSTGCSEVVKVTDHLEADRAVQESPNMYYKSGPFLVT